MALQAAALAGSARNAAGQLLQVQHDVAWRQQHLQRLGLSGGGPKQRLEVCQQRKMAVHEDTATSRCFVSLLVFFLPLKPLI